MSIAKINVRGELPRGWWFETERAAHFPQLRSTEGSPRTESVYRTRDNSKGKPGYFIMNVQISGETDNYFELSKEEAISWLISQGYLTGDQNVEEQLQTLVLERMPLPADPYMEAVEKAIENGRQKQRLRDMLPDAK